MRRTKSAPALTIEFKKWYHRGTIASLFSLLVHNPAISFMLPRSFRMTINCAADPDVSVCPYCDAVESWQFVAARLPDVRTQHHGPFLTVKRLYIDFLNYPEDSVVIYGHRYHPCKLRAGVYFLVTTVLKAPHPKIAAKPDCPLRTLNDM